jgi:flagellar protein FliO/FliZ
MQRLILFLCLSGLQCPVFAEAALTQNTGRTLVLADLMRWSGALVFVLAVFFAFVWLMRKTGHYHSVTAQQLQVIGGLSLGAKERVVLLQVGKKQILLGVSPGRVETLHVLTGDECLSVQNNQGQTGELGGFAQKLAQVMQGGVRE